MQGKGARFKKVDRERGWRYWGQKGWTKVRCEYTSLNTL